jgi:RimJ/RimL family protein N-acetyltransferase
MLFTTERLRIRLLTLDDAPFIQELVNQPSWLKYIGERNVRSIADAEGYLTKGPLASYAEHGFGLWGVELIEDGTPIGVSGLLKRPFLDHPDLGFAFLERFQGQRYGIEAVTATAAYARRALGVKALLAVVDPENIGSIRILEKVGLQHRGPILMPGETEPIALYGTPPLP